MKVLILAAGYAVRLQPLTLNAPKPLLEIGGKKIIDRILDKVAFVKGVDAVYIITNHKFSQNFQNWLKSSKQRKKISLIDDGTSANDGRLGAIRDMELAIKEKSISDDLLVIAGDNLFDLDIGQFLNFSKEHDDGISIALHDVGSIEEAKRFGVVGIDKDNKVVEFEEKPENPKSTLISTGIYYFPKDKVAELKDYVASKDAKLDTPGYYIKWLSANDKVYGFSFSEKWYDIGDLESYKRADKEYKERKG